jgi:hypothetical protein
VNCGVPDSTPSPQNPNPLPLRPLIYGFAFFVDRVCIPCYSRAHLLTQSNPLHHQIKSTQCVDTQSQSCIMHTYQRNTNNRSGTMTMTQADQAREFIKYEAEDDDDVYEYLSKVTGLEEDDVYMSSGVWTFSDGSCLKYD